MLVRVCIGLCCRESTNGVKLAKNSLIVGERVAVHEGRVSKSDGGLVLNRERRSKRNNLLCVLPTKS